MSGPVIALDPGAQACRGGDGRREVGAEPVGEHLVQQDCVEHTVRQGRRIIRARHGDRAGVDLAALGEDGCAESAKQVDGRVSLEEGLREVFERPHQRGPVRLREHPEIGIHDLGEPSDVVARDRVGELVAERAGILQITLRCRRIAGSTRA